MTHEEQLQQDIDFLETIRDRLEDMHSRYDGDIYGKTHVGDLTGGLCDVHGDLICTLEKARDNAGL